jgi:NAD(P)-dependent dehydrogenase (short-subunit alcohol dehydrogenase family)
MMIGGDDDCRNTLDDVFVLHVTFSVPMLYIHKPSELEHCVLADANTFPNLLTSSSNPSTSFGATMSSSHRVKTVLITGCSSGIGAALALEFARRGLKVIATARTKLDLQKLRESHRNITALRLDVHEKNAILALKNEVGQITGGGLDYLVNNAGAHYASPAMDIDISKVRQIFEVNVFAVMHMCEAFSRLLIARKGVIIQIGSVTRDVPMICQSPYNATKAALSQYTRTLRLVSFHHF